jgi:hypothetical protein
VPLFPRHYPLFLLNLFLHTNNTLFPKSFIAVCRINNKEKQAGFTDTLKMEKEVLPVGLEPIDTLNVEYAPGMNLYLSLNN